MPAFSSILRIAKLQTFYLCDSRREKETLGYGQSDYTFNTNNHPLTRLSMDLTTMIPAKEGSHRPLHHCHQPVLHIPSLKKELFRKLTRWRTGSWMFDGQIHLCREENHFCPSRFAQWQSGLLRSTRATVVVRTIHNALLYGNNITTNQCYSKLRYDNGQRSQRFLIITDSVHTHLFPVHQNNWWQWY